MRIEVKLGIDELGAPEEFTWDLFPVVDAKVTQYLQECGLPKLGTVIRPGMIVVGRIGKSIAYDCERQPSVLEIHGLSFEALRSKYGHMRRNTSVCAGEDTFGVVTRAFFEGEGPSQIAIVELEDSSILEQINATGPIISH